MKTDEFIERVQDAEIVAAIRHAEHETSGEIRVFISRKPAPDAVAAAQRQFERLGMTKTRERNGVLFFLAPRSRTFAIVGDQAIHAHCGEGFWKKLASEMTKDFRQAQFTRGLVRGITRAGELLVEHFPRQPDDKNELPDGIERD